MIIVVMLNDIEQYMRNRSTHLMYSLLYTVTFFKIIADSLFCGVL